MKVLLYRMGRNDSFKLYTNPVNLTFGKNMSRVAIEHREGIDTWDQVRHQEIMLTDDTKNIPDVVIKITLEHPTAHCSVCDHEKTDAQCVRCKAKSWVRSDP